MTEPSSVRPSLDLLRGFEAAARHLSFTHAAQELFVTQSAVSRQIKTLEDGLGVQLFVRGARGIALTEAGERLYRAVSAALGQVQEAIASLTSAASRTVTVTCTLAFCSLWLIPRLLSFQKAHPGVEVHISAANEVVNHDRSRIDVTDGDRAALACQCPHDRRAEPARRARDERRLAGELHGSRVRREGRGEISTRR